MRWSRCWTLCAGFVVVACGGSGFNDLVGAGADAGSGDAALPPQDAAPVDGGGDGSGLVCAPGTADCDGNANNGCEVNTLADDGHCGGCAPQNACATGSSCQSGACVAGPATVVPPGTFQIGDFACLAIDATHVYVGSGRQNGSVYRVPKVGGASVAVANAQNGPRAVAVDRTGLYWGNYGDGVITRSNPDGSSPQVVFRGSAGLVQIALDAASVYFTNGTSGSVGKVDKNGANPRPIFNGPGPCSPTPCGSFQAGELTLGAGSVFYTNPYTSQIMRAPDNGGVAPTPIASGVNGVRGVVFDQGSVYFGASPSASAGLVAVVSQTGGSITNIATSQPGANMVATDGRALYWSNRNATGAIMKRAQGGAPVPVATGQAFPMCLAVDGSSVFWINENGGAVMRAAK
jgi:hypothetical protein